MSASSGQLSPAPSAVPSNADLKSLEGGSTGDLEWRICEISARWLLAGRNVAEEDPDMTHSDAIAGKIRVSGLAFFAAIQVCGCTVGVIFSIMTGYARTLYICIAQMLAVGLVLGGMHIANRSRKVSMQHTTDASALMLVVFCLFGITCLWPFNTVFAHEGWHWSTAVVVWQWASAMGPILVLKSNPILTGCVAFLITVAMDCLLIASCRMWVGDGPTDLVDTDTFGFSMLSVLTSYAMVPPVVALCFRRACQEYRWKLDAVRSHQERLDSFRASSRFLIFTLIPPVRATQLTHSSPALWHRGSQDTWEECSLVQMDVSGFTAMSSRIGSEELVGLINALFTSTEYAAECIGNIWVVELIGDCCKFMVGGPSPCPDHAYRAAVLAYSIVEVFKHVALRLGVALTVRVGIHTGTVVGAVVGSSMPRYLLHGRACEVVGRLETSAPPGGVLASATTAAALGDAWPHEEAQAVALADGTQITGRLSDAASIDARMAAARLAYPALGKMLSDFETGVFDAMTASSQASQAAGAGGNASEDANLAGAAGLGAGSSNYDSFPSRMARVVSSETFHRTSAVSDEPDEEAACTSSPESSQHERHPPSFFAPRLLRAVSAAPVAGQASSARVRPSSPPRRALSQASQKSLNGSPIAKSSGGRGLLAARFARALSSGPQRAPSAEDNGVSSLVAAETEARREARAASSLVSRIRNFTSWNTSVHSEETRNRRKSVIEVAAARKRLSSVFHGGLGRSPSVGHGGAWLAFADPPRRRPPDAPTSPPLPSAGQFEESRSSRKESRSGDVASMRSTIVARRSVSLRGSVGTAGSWPSSLSGHRSQAVLMGEEEGSGEGGEGDAKRDREGHTDSQWAAEQGPGGRAGRNAMPAAPAVPAVPALRLSSGRRGTQERAAGLRALPDGRPPTRLLALVEERASGVRSSSVVSLQEWQADLLGIGEEAVPAGATLDPEQEARAAAGWENKHGATPVEFQRSLVLAFIAVLAVVTGVHTAVVAALHWTGQIGFYVWHTRAVQHLVVALPALQLLLLLAAILVHKRSTLDWGSGTPQLVATLLVFIAPFALEGSVSGRSGNAAAVLWAGAAVLIPCSTTPVDSSRWWAWMAGYWVVCFALLGWQEYKSPGGVEPLTRDVALWRDTLIALHFWATGALMLTTIGLAASKVALEQDKGRLLFHKTKSEAFLEGKLLNALLPAGVIERFLRGDTLISDHIQDGTVMFVYIHGYRETLLEHGTAATILWINRVFEALDACISRTSAIIKVETFNDFLLVYSKQPETHVDDCISLAIDMLDSIRLVLRPDGASTTVKLGASSGDFTAGIIGSSAPRYSIFGDTVNTASRMAAHARPCTLSSFFMHLSDTAKHKVGVALEGWLMANLTLSIVENGLGMEIKGKGWMQTFCLCKASMDGIQERPGLQGRA